MAVRLRVWVALSRGPIPNPNLNPSPNPNPNQVGSSRCTMYGWRCAYRPPWPWVTRCSQGW